MSNTGGRKYETYTQAVEAACRGDQEAFTFLYESTYRDKFFIAWKYLRKEEDAQDVLQDAYMKAWENLATLKEPEKFPGWLSMIVANTALNSLNKKKALPFSALEQTTEEGDTFAFEEEDWRKEYQPEHAYTDKETSELLKEMLDALSDEQRFCMLMYYVEEHSVKEIADLIGCSENTVKSRLNYGRKNLQAKADELEKKGYSLYGIAPLPLLLLLLRTQAKTTQIAIPALNTAEAASLALSGGSAGSAATPAASTASNASSTSATTTSTSASTGTSSASVAGAASSGAATSTSASTGASSAGASGTTASAGAATASVTAATAATGAASSVSAGNASVTSTGSASGKTVITKTSSVLVRNIAIGFLSLAVLSGIGFGIAKLFGSKADASLQADAQSTGGADAIVAEDVSYKWVVSDRKYYSTTDVVYGHADTPKLSAIYTMQYDDKGRMISEETTNMGTATTNGTGHSVRTYEYDENGNMIRVVSKNLDRNTVSETLYEYDSANRLVKWEAVPGGNGIVKHTTSYNPDGSYVTTNYSSGDVLYSIHYYDASGKTTHTVSYDKTGENITNESFSEITKYTGYLPECLAGKEIWSNTRVSAGEEPRLEGFTCTERDDMDRLILSAYCNYGSNYTWSITHYVYDDEGRITSATYEIHRPDGNGGYRILTGIAGEYEYIRVPDYDAAD